MTRPASILIAVALTAAPLRADDTPVSFRRDVAPILVRHCLTCHGEKNAKGKYRLHTFEALVSPGGSGLPAVEPGEPDESELFLLITDPLAEERMPRDADALPPEQIALIKRWIVDGAAFDGGDRGAPLISLLPPREHPPPPAAYPAAIPVSALAFTPEGKNLIAGGYHELTVWDPADGTLVRRINGFAQRTYALSFSPDGSMLAVAGGTPGELGEVRLLDGATLELKHVLLTTPDVVFDTAFDAAGERLAAVGAEGRVYILDPKTGQQLASINAHSDWVLAASFSPDGGAVATGSRDRSAKVFDLTTGEQVTAYTGHKEQVNGVAFHPDGKQVYSAGRDGEIHLWTIDEAKKQWDQSAGGEVFELAAPAAGGGGAMLMAPSADGKVRRFKLADHELVREYAGHRDWVLCAALHDRTNRLASGGFDGKVRVFDSEDGRLVSSFIAAPGLKDVATGER